MDDTLPSTDIGFSAELCDGTSTGGIGDEDGTILCEVRGSGSDLSGGTTTGPLGGVDGTTP